MTIPASITTRNLQMSDIPDAMCLKNAAGWNQTEADWAGLLALSPSGCFGIHAEGRLAATSTVICYGRDLAWLGMVLTLPEFRGRGFARKLVERCLAHVDALGVACTKLDATEMGRDLYRRFGFEDERIVERWMRQPRQVDGGGAAEGFVFEPDLDHQAFGAKRHELVDALAVRGEAASVLQRGYAMSRPGSRAAYFGPCVARDADAAQTLVRWFLARHGDEAAFWDLIPDNAAAVEIARAMGFAPVRRLVRMTRGSGGASMLPGGAVNTVFALAGFEYG